MSTRPALSPSQIQTRDAWLRAARHGERATLIRLSQSPEVFPWHDAKASSDVFMAAMSNKGLPALRFLATLNCTIPSDALIKAIGRLAPSEFSGLLADRPWPKSPSPYHQMHSEADSLVSALLGHPQGWQAASDNILLAISRGCCVSRPSYEPSLLGSLSNLSPERWNKLGSCQDHAFDRLVAGGMRPCGWDDDPQGHPPMGHPLRQAAEKGNVLALACCLESTTSAFSAWFADLLVEGAMGRLSSSKWNHDPATMERFCLALVRRSGSVLPRVMNRLNEQAQQGRLDPAVLSVIAKETLLQSTPHTPRVASSPRL